MNSIEEYNVESLVTGCECIEEVAERDARCNTRVETSCVISE